MIMRPNYALKLTSAATGCHWRVAAPGGGARTVTRIR